MVRASSRELLAGFFTPVQGASNFDVEFSLSCTGFRLAVQYSDHIWVELDTANVVSVLVSGGGGSAGTRHTLSSILLLCGDCHVRFTHIFREGNQAADYLASRGTQTSTFTTFDSSTIADQLGYPNFITLVR